MAVGTFGRRPTSTGENANGSATSAPSLRRPAVPVQAASVNTLLRRAPLPTGTSGEARPEPFGDAAPTFEPAADPLLRRSQSVVSGFETFAVRGQEMQFVEIVLGTGETAVAEAGGMMFKDAAVGMETKMSDGSESGIMGKVVGAAKRTLAGENLFMTHFTNQGGGKATVAFAAAYPGKIVPIKLADHGGALNCQRDAFLCGIKGVSIGIAFQKKILAGLFGGGGFVIQKLEGEGLVFIHSGGTMVERTLAAGERIHVDPGCVVAYEQSVSFDVARVGGVKSMFLGGEGLFFAELSGPGRVWLQSLPFSRLAARMMAGAAGGHDRALFGAGRLSHLSGGGSSSGSDVEDHDASPYEVSEVADADAAETSSSLLGTVGSLFSSN